jgi:ketosteroid isomerase-like protein
MSSPQQSSPQQSGPVQQFADRLQELERTRDLDAFLGVFADDVHLVRPEGRGDAQGLDGARRFWQAYLDQFQDIASTFSRTVGSGSLGELEWTGEGRLPTGRSVSYRGVSLLELDDEGRVTRFATYYDTAAFLAPPV